MVCTVQLHGRDVQQEGSSVDAEAAEDWAIENGAEFVDVNLNRDNTIDGE